MIHDHKLTRSVRAMLLAGAHLHRKDAGGDPFELLTKKFGEHVGEVMKKLDALKGKSDDHDALIMELAQKMVRSGRNRSSGFDDDSGRDSTWGERFIQAKSSDLRRIASERGRTSLEIKATITSATTNADGSAGDLVVPQRDTLIGMPRRRMTIRNLLNVVQVSSGSVEYAKQTGRTNNAAPVSEGGAKPSSDLKFTLEPVQIRTIAHWLKASRQIIEDAPQLRDFIDQELRYGLGLEEESQLLYGDGTGQNLEGMVTQATAFADPLTLSGANMIDNIGSAILQASLTDIPPDGIILHPSDWWRMRLTKDGDGKYILGDPMTVVQPSLFGLPVVATQAMDVDTFLVGSFASQTLYDRWNARVEVGFENDDFTRNLVTILGEERIGFAAKRPESLIVGDFGNVSG